MEEAKTLEERVEHLEDVLLGRRPVEVKTEQLTEDVEQRIYDYIKGAESRFSEQVLEVSSDYERLYSFVHDVQKDFQRRVSEVESLRAEVVNSVIEFRALAESLEKQISKAQALAERLEKLLADPRRLFVVRPAQPHELRDPGTLPFRQASADEVRAAALADQS